MSEKRLSEIMADSSHAVSEAQEVLDQTITQAINTHFDAGIAIERERIIKLLEEQEVEGWFDRGLKELFIELIKGENKIGN